MRKLWTTATLLFVTGCVHQNPSKSQLQYPSARIEDISDNYFGYEVHDPYRWLENKSSNEVKHWNEAEARLARNYLDKLPHRSQIRKSLQVFTHQDSFSAPLQKGNYLFYGKRPKDSEKGIVFISDLDGKNERVLFDSNKELPKNISLGPTSASLDGSKWAYTVHENNNDEETVYVRDTSNLQDSKIDIVHGLKYDQVEWDYTASGFYYAYFGKDSEVPADERIARAVIKYHKLGTNQKSDLLISGPTHNQRIFPFVTASSDGTWLFVQHSTSSQNKTIFAKDLTDPHSRLRKIIDIDATVQINSFHGYFYILTNYHSPHSKILRIPYSSAGLKDAEVVIPESKSKFLQSFEIVGGHLVVNYIENVSSHLFISNLEGRERKEIEIGKNLSLIAVDGNPKDSQFYISTESFFQPSRISKVDIESGEMSLWKEQKLPVDASQFQVSQEWFTSKDKTRVPLFILRKKGLKRNGKTPFVLNAYGGFSSSQLPSYHPGVMAWLEQGGGYAIANIRGGGEFGEEWHRAAMKQKKQNSFDDFAAAAKYLSDSKYTSPSKLAVAGGSLGGLLVSVLLVQHPELFRAALSEIPSCDMIRYPLFGDGKFWTTEYGSPENKEDFFTLLSYSPYHHVEKGNNYPALLTFSSADDDRVDPLHARKFTAALQAVSSTKHPILLRLEQNAGHAGPAGVSGWTEVQVDKYSFLLDQLR